MMQITLYCWCTLRGSGMIHTHVWLLGLSVLKQHEPNAPDWPAIILTRPMCLETKWSSQ